MMAKAPTVQEFFKQFPDDDACLEHLMGLRFGNPLYCPKCSAEGQFAKLKKLPAYACPTCGHHIHPMVGTPFERSHTPLQKWFYAMYLFTTSRHGVPAKELQRQRVSGPELGKRLGVRDYPLQKTLEQAPRFTAERLSAAHRLLTETDERIKSGRARDEVALDLLVADLGSLKS